MRNLLGLALDDARRIAQELIARDGAISSEDLPYLGRAKFSLLAGDGVLQLEMETARFGDIAGLNRLKRWVALRRAVFLGESDARTAGRLDAPKGVLLLGVQGCGKSLAAKAMAGGLGVPLLRMDFGAVHDKYHGETERKLREALKTAEAMAPCVLWVDEIEKGVSSGQSDGGTSTRVLGTLLTWMAERKARVFMVATANDIRGLPPELVRKGRFDEIFFVDLPSPEVRAEILRLHLSRREIDPSGYDLAALASAAEGFSGAELEQSIVSALYAALEAGSAPSQTQLLQEIQGTRPLSVLMAEQIDWQREWARQRTVAADE